MPHSTADRQAWMAVLARAPAASLEDAAAAHLPPYTRLRGPEVGLVMLQGRAGGTGAAFNLGEATVARCTVRSDTGQVGHAYCLGRDLRQAELAAVLDAALQDPARHDAVQDACRGNVIGVAPLAQQQARVLHAADRLGDAELGHNWILRSGSTTDLRQPDFGKGRGQCASGAFDPNRDFVHSRSDWKVT